MSYVGFLKMAWIPVAMICGLAFACGCSGDGAAQPGATLGNMKADRILVFGNSITLHGVHVPYGWLNFCGMAASVPEKDYVHLVAAGIETRTGHHLDLNNKTLTRPRPDGSVHTRGANVINIADILERQYPTYTNARLQAQFDWKADIVILQCGENTPMDVFNPVAFKHALQTLMAGLKASSNPHIFVTSHILGTSPAMDVLKREVCAEDPFHRVFVDLNDFHKDPTNFASAEKFYTGVIVGHPGDKGMETIANALLKAIFAQADR